MLLLQAKRAVQFLDHLAKSKRSRHCHLRGELAYGYDPIFEVDVTHRSGGGGYAMHVSWLANLTELIEMCPVETVVAYGLLKEHVIGSEGSNHPFALLVNRQEKKIAYYTSFGNDDDIQHVAAFTIGILLPGTEVIHFPLAFNPAKRLMRASEFVLGTELTAPSFTVMYTEFLHKMEVENTYTLKNYVSMWPELAPLEPYMGEEWNRKDWPYLSLFVERVAKMYSLDASSCKRRRLAAGKRSAHIDIDNNGITLAGDEGISLRRLVESACRLQRERIVVLSVSIDTSDIPEHANALIIDTHKKEAELYEPNGYHGETVDKLLQNYLKIELPGYTFIPPVDFSPVFGLQNFHMVRRQRLDPEFQIGLCVTFTLMFTVARVLNPDFKRETIIDVLMEEISQRDMYVEKFVTFVKNVLLQQDKISSHGNAMADMSSNMKTGFSQM